MSNLTSTIKSIQDIMRKDAGVDGDAQRLSQLGWMLFLKIFDEKENDWEILNDNYKSPIPKDLRWRTWAADEEGMTGDELLSFNLLNRSWTEWSNKHRVDIIVTNPPFGGMEEDGVENNFPAQYRTRETANLFMSLVIHLLKDGGRCGLVLPDGFLFGEGVATRIKEILLQKCNLHTIVRLPNGVFAPYTGIKTNLLFFTKGKPTTDVWYFEHPYPDGVKNYNKTKPINIKEFDLEKAWWNNREENAYAWKVSAEELKKRNYNFDIKNPNSTQEQHQYTSNELIALLGQSFAKSNQLLKQLEEELV